MRHEESAAYVAAIGILAFAIEDLLIMIVVVQVDSTIESQHNDLRYLQKGAWKSGVSK